MIRKNKKQKRQLIDVEKELQQYKEKELVQANNEAENIAITNPPKHIEDLLTMPAPQRIWTGFNSKSAGLGVLFDKPLQGFLTSYNQAVEDFNSTEISEANSEIERIEKEKQEAIESAIKAHDETIEEKKEALVLCKGAIKNLKIALSSMKSYRLWPRNVFGAIVILTILCGEVFMNADSFEYAGFSQFYAQGIGFAVAGVTFILGISLAFLMRKKEWSRAVKIGASVAILALVFGLYYTLGSIRVSMMTFQASAEGLFALTALHFVVFNMAFFISIFAIKLFVFATPKMLKANEDFRKTSKRLQNEELKYKALQEAINNAHKTREKAKTRVIKQYEDTLKNARAKINKNIQNIKTTAIEYNELLSKAQLFFAQVNSDCKSVLASFFSKLNLYRNDGLTLAIPDLKDLENPFKTYKPIPTFEGSNTP